MHRLLVGATMGAGHMGHRKQIGGSRGRGTMGIARVKGPIEGMQMPPRGTDNVRIAAPDPKGQSWLDIQVTTWFNYNRSALTINIDALSLAAFSSFEVMDVVGNVCHFVWAAVHAQ